MFVDKDQMAERFLLNQFHTWPRPMSWWQYGLLLSFLLSGASVWILVRKCL